MKRLKDSTLLPEQVLGWSYNQFISSITELSLDPAISHQVVYVRNTTNICHLYNKIK